MIILKSNVCFLCFVFVILFCPSCKEKKAAQYLDGEQQIVDSFWIKGLASKEELLYLNYMNDSMLYSFSRTKQIITFYKNRNGNRHYEKSNSIQLKKSAYTVFFVGAKTKKSGMQFFLFDNDQHKIYVYNESGDLLYTHKINFIAPYLKTEYNLYSDNNHKAKIIGDTLITTIVDQRADQANMLLKEAPLFKFICNKDTFYLLKTMGEKPTNRNDYYGNFQDFCYQNGKIKMIYPDFDSLYIFNISDNYFKKQLIGNKDYQIPDEFHYPVGKPDYFSKLNELWVKSFKYLGIYADLSSNKTALFYFKPMEIKDDKNKLPIPGHQPLYILVLSKNDEPENYYKLPALKYDTWGIFSMPKGIVLLTYKKEINEKDNVKFTVFSF